MSDLFGAPIGEMAFNTDQLVQAKTQDVLSDIAMKPAQQRFIEAKTRSLELAEEQDRKLSALAMSMQFGDGQSAEAFESGEAPPSMADHLDKIAGLAANAGMITKAEKLAKDAALIRSREANQARLIGQAQNDRLRGIRERAELVSQIFGGVNDAAGWQRANELFEFQTGVPSPYGNVPFSTELVTGINQAALNAKERADILDKELKRKADEKFRKERLRQHDERNAIAKARADAAKAREERLAKQGGGKAISSPTKGMLDRATNQIKTDFPEIVAADRNDAAYTIAAEAQRLRRQNPALSDDIAIGQALQNAKVAGDFHTDEGNFLGIGKKTTFLGRGKTPEVPAAIPKDKGSLVKDRYYVNSKGQVAKWNGSGFVSSAPLSRNNGNPNAAAVTDTGDEDDDDDE